MASQLFDDIKAGLEEAIAIRRGEKPDTLVTHQVEVEVIDVKALRERFKMTQQMFADTFQFKVDTVRQWERQRRTPRGPERVLLKVIEKEPEAVKRALAG